MLQHYVFLKYREGTTEGHILAFCERMWALSGALGEIQRLEIGRDELHDARSWDLVLIMEFASAEALRAYQRHPDHLAVMTFNDPFVANVASVDFNAAGRTRTEWQAYKKPLTRVGLTTWRSFSRSCKRWRRSWAGEE